MGKETGIEKSALAKILAITALLLTGPAAAGSVIIQNGQINASNSFNASNVLFVNPVTGYVGIGTATSTRPLQIAAAQDAVIRLQDTSGSAPAAYVEFYNDTTRWGYVGLGGHDDKMVIGTNIEKSLSFYTNDSPKMTLTAAGNVGIGTTSPSMRLELVGSLANTDSENILGLTRQYYEGVSHPNAAAFALSHPSDNTPNSRLDIKLSNQLYTPNPNITVMSLRADGNVGIGTMSPSAKLDVVGGQTISGSLSVGRSTYYADAKIHIFASGGGRIIQMNANDSDVSTSVYQLMAAKDSGGINRWWNFGVNSDNSFRINPGPDNIGGSMFVVSSSGNVGIGTTSPSTLLHVAKANGDAYIIMQRTGTSASSYSVGTQATGFAIYDQTAATTRLAIGSSGNVGIGTTSPSSVLEIYKASSGIGPTLTLNNPTGAVGSAGVAIDFVGYSPASQPITNRIQTIDDGTYGYHMAFLTKADSSGGALFEAVRIQGGTGNVGIGNTAPTGRLSVEGAASDASLTSKATSLVSITNPTNDLEFAIGQMAGAPYATWLQNRNYEVTGQYYPIALQPLGGSVGIGTTSPGYTLTVAGTAWVTSGSWSGSDARWKRNVTALSPSSSLDKILALRPVNFEWKTEEYPKMGFTNGTQVGFIAQDVEKIIPEVVTTDNNGYKGMSYERLTPVITGAMQEQQKQIEVLKAENGLLKAELCAKDRTYSWCD
ncbi:MAG: tail fiber domain-containing protein [Candidatus Micrarchaeia archaeon]